MRKAGLRLMAMLCAVVLLVVAVPYTAQARGLNDIREEINEKKALLDSLEGKIKANQNNKKAAEEALAQYEEEYNKFIVLIDEQELMIAKTTADLEYKREQLSYTMQNIQDSKETYEDRMQAIYRMNSTNAAMASMLSVDSFADMQRLSDAMRRISQRDLDMIAEMAAQRAEYERQNTELEAEIIALDEELTSMHENRDYCLAKMEEMQVAITAANQAILASQQKSKEAEKEIKDLEAEYAAIFRALQQQGSKKGDGSVRYDGPILWPVTGGYMRISSYFGAPRKNHPHYGIDIPCPTGTPIQASGTGTVITSTYHYSYGYYIVIDHGDGLRTLYAHNSQLLKNKGDFVTMGDIIALAGNTGNSYGSHCHFEVHDNGARQNPLGSGYLNV